MNIQSLITLTTLSEHPVCLAAHSSTPFGSLWEITGSTWPKPNFYCFHGKFLPQPTSQFMKLDSPNQKPWILPSSFSPSTSQNFVQLDLKGIKFPITSSTSSPHSGPDSSSTGLGYSIRLLLGFPACGPPPCSSPLCIHREPVKT